MGKKKTYDWKQDLKNRLVRNRSEMQTGSGNKYWNSVLKVIEDFARRNDPPIDFGHCQECAIACRLDNCPCHIV